MLFLFSDVSERDAPTRIRIGSQLTVARLLAPAGEQGMSMIDISKSAELASRGAKEAVATGDAGTVYLCHPFLLHAAQPHHGSVPRFMAQPPLLPRILAEAARSGRESSPVDRAIFLALH